MKIGYVLPVVLAFTSLANAVELHQVIVRIGTDGLDMVPLTISNSGKDGLSCNADFAHWYSGGVATVEPGKSAHVELWFDPEPAPSPSSMTSAKTCRSSASGVGCRAAHTRPACKSRLTALM